MSRAEYIILKLPSLKMPIVKMKFRATIRTKHARSEFLVGALDGLEKATMAFEGKAKSLTTSENHVVTGRYRGSINQSKASPASYVRGGFSPTNDGVHEQVARLHWRSGTNVEYAPDLEKKYSIFARAMDGVRGDVADIIARSLISL